VYSPVQAADEPKVLRVLFNTAETSFDPQWASDAASDSVIENIYEAMLDYDYLARPLQLVPRTLEAMPTVQDNGATYVFRIRKGIHFTPDPAFKGKPRELTAADHAYGLKRLLDPAVKSPWRWSISRPNNRFTIQVKELKNNVAIDDAKFAKPSGDLK